MTLDAVKQNYVEDMQERIAEEILDAFYPECPRQFGTAEVELKISNNEPI